MLIAKNPINQLLRGAAQTSISSQATLKQLKYSLEIRHYKLRSCASRTQTETSNAPVPYKMPEFEVVNEETIHQRYLTLYDRKVRITPNDGEATHLNYDIIGHPRSNFRFGVVVPFHRATAASDPEVTLIREYCQGVNAVCFSLPAGGFDARKHATLEDCVKAELSEEALLWGGTLERLVPEDHPGFAEVKWCANRFIPFIAIDPQPDPNPGERDAEEYIEVKRVGIPEFRRLLDNGEMMLPSIVTGNLALKYLEGRGLIERACGSAE